MPKTPRCMNFCPRCPQFFLHPHQFVFGGCVVQPAVLSYLLWCVVRGCCLVLVALSLFLVLFKCLLFVFLPLSSCVRCLCLLCLVILSCVFLRAPHPPTMFPPTLPSPPHRYQTTSKSLQHSAYSKAHAQLKVLSLSCRTLSCWFWSSSGSCPRVRSWSWSLVLV